MKCPFCGSTENGVVDSRMTEDGRAIRRRRSCPPCGKRFTTYERVDELPHLVIKRDGAREAFDRRKLIDGMMRACEKRPVPVARLEKFALDIERKAQDLGEREISSRWIGEQVMDVLRHIDEVAFVRYARVYRQYRDVDDFVSELEKLRSARPVGSEHV